MWFKKFAANTHNKTANVIKGTAGNLNMDLIIIIAAVIVGTISGFVGTLAGGGGLISIPFLIFIGLPAEIAIATNKFGSIGLSIGAFTKFKKAKKIRWEYIPIFCLLCIIGGVLGAQSLVAINKEHLNKIVGILIVCLLPLLFLKRDLGVKSKKVTAARKKLGYLLYLCVTIFAGFFGGGASILMYYTLMFFFGFTIIESSATHSITRFTISIASIVVFAYYGMIEYLIGGAVMLGRFIGGYLGAHTAIKKGNMWVKGFFVIGMVVSSAKLLFF